MRKLGALGVVVLHEVKLEPFTYTALALRGKQNQPEKSCPMASVKREKEKERKNKGKSV